MLTSRAEAGVFYIERSSAECYTTMIMPRQMNLSIMYKRPERLELKREASTRRSKDPSRCFLMCHDPHTHNTD
eukprot:47754-Eustigmatos_ZCMA.PRE.1